MMNPRLKHIVAVGVEAPAVGDGAGAAGAEAGVVGAGVGAAGVEAGMALAAGAKVGVAGAGPIMPALGDGAGAGPIMRVSGGLMGAMVTTPTATQGITTRMTTAGSS